MGLVDCENHRATEFAFGVALRFLEERLAHEPVACRREDLALQVFDLEVFFLLVDHHRPTLLCKRLGRDVRADVDDLWEAQERPFWVFHCINDVVAESRHPRLTAKVMIGIAQLARFECLRIIGTKFFNVDVLEVRLWGRSEADARRLEELHDLAGVAIN